MLSIVEIELQYVQAFMDLINRPFSHIVSAAKS